MAGALLRGALQRGVPVTRSARLREVGGGDGLRRLPGRQRRRRCADDREGERDQRPPRGDRLPYRLAREGVSDGAGGRVERRHHPRARAGRRRPLMTMPYEAPRHHILTVLVENKPGVLSRVAGLFSRRGFNIFSLAVSPTEDDRLSRTTIVVDAESAPLEQVVKQLNKLINVIKITELPSSDGVEREMLMVTVRASAELRNQVTELASIFEGKIVDVGYEAMTIMVAGEPDKLDAFSDLVKPYGIVELQRTGRIALARLARQPVKLRAVKTARA